MKNKSFSIVCVFLLIIITFNCVSLGYTSTGANNTKYYFPDQVTNYLSYSEFNDSKYSLVGLDYNSSCYYVFAFVKTNKLRIATYPDWRKRYITTNSPTTIYLLKFDHDSCKLINTACYNNYTLSRDNFSNFIGGECADTDNLLFVNCDIYDENYGSFDKLLFQTAPLKEGATNLARILRVTTEKASPVAEVLGVLPLIIVVVVSFLGLRKALKMLSTFLNRS